VADGHVTETIDSMMADPRFDRFVREYFGQWLPLGKSDGLIFEFKHVPDYGVARKHFAKEQLYEFVSHIINGNAKGRPQTRQTHQDG
jgi:hypothetical protein